MSKMKKMLAAVFAGALMAGVMSAPSAVAQDAQQGRGRGNFDPAQARERMMENMKTQLGASDEEWKVLQPKLQKVMDARRDATAGGGGGFGGLGRGGPGGAGGDRGGDRGGRGGDRGGDRGGRGGFGGDPNSPVAAAQTALRAAVEDKSTSPDELSRRLNALRDARAKARESLARSQAELKELLTARQEAMLVAFGMLE